MFSDARSKRILIVAHCLLNQNAKLDRCAFYPGAIREAAQVIIDSGVGIVQMPCPELVCLGLDRSANPLRQASVEDEDTRISEEMQKPENARRLKTMAEDLADQVLEYRRHGFEVLGVVGINGSPTCAVERTWYGGAPQDGPGIFVIILQQVLQEKGLHLPMRAIRAAEPVEALQVLKALCD